MKKFILIACLVCATSIKAQFLFNRTPETYVVTLSDSFVQLPSGLSYENKLKVAYNTIGRVLQTSGLKDFTINNVYVNSLSGFTITASGRTIHKLKRFNFVEELEKVTEFKTNYELNGVIYPLPQMVPYGVKRVNGGKSKSEHKAWVFDTGIDKQHEDLNVNNQLSKSFVGNTSTLECGVLGLLFGCPSEPGNDYTDRQGHGTHVAGIIGAKNNGVGTIGVAPGNDLVAIKVLNDNGSGTTNGIIAGIDYAMEYAKPGDVANFSLGGGASRALDNAVVRLSNKGVFVVIAAGNESRNANTTSPARANGKNILTISAMDATDEWADYSNYGTPPVDYCAPGTNIVSTYHRNRYARLSGTSMAAPHAAGILLLNGMDFATSGRVSNDPDGNDDFIINCR